MKNPIEKFSIEVVDRNIIHMSDYNPRKISKEAREKLKKEIKKYGLLQPIIVNKNTGNVVAGHQRLAIMDEINKSTDYQITVAWVNLTEEEEVKVNVLLNNTSVMGEWDYEKLAELKNIFDFEIDYIEDLGFDQADLTIMGLNANDEEILQSVLGTSITKNEVDNLAYQSQVEKMKEQKKALREKLKDLNEQGDQHAIEKDDYLLTFIFGSTPEKRDFMRKIGMPPDEKFINANYLYRIERGEFRK